MSNIGNLCKGFLKAGDLDADGEVVKENGLMKFLGSDDRIHGNWSLTETGRPRSWKPNTLNLPAYMNRGVFNGLVRVLDRIGVPSEFEEFFGSPEDPPEKRIAGFPSIRSSITAPEGFCFVESDFKTAEIRAQAFISGDKNLIRLMTEPDPAFVRLKEGGVVRLFFPKDSGIRPAEADPSLVLRKPDGSLVRPEDFARDAKGTPLHPPHDLHWSLAEMRLGKPREVLDKGSRNAAKIANFSCLSAKTPIITEKRGARPIANISLDDRVWDGAEWVRHEGSKYQGERHTIGYSGLRATPDHVVWLANGRKVCFGEAALGALPLHRSERAGEVLQRPPSEIAGGSIPRHGAALREDHACFRSQLPEEGHQGTVRVGQGVCPLGAGDLAGFGFQAFGFRPHRQRRPLRAGQSAACDAFGELEEHAHIGRVQPGEGRIVQGFAPGGELHCEDLLEFVSAGLHGEDDLAEMGGCREARAKEETPCGRHERGGGGQESESGSALERETFGGIAVARSFGRGAFAPGEGLESPKEEIVDREVELESSRRRYAQIDREDESGRALRRMFEDAGFEVRLEPVYDIVNAGPRRRFTANGFLVSNSSYGAVGRTLERKIEADTGIKPEEGSGDELLEALARRQPVAFEWLEDLARAPARGEILVAASGRKRRFPIHPSDLKGLSKRVRQAYLRPMGNEARNFYPQEGVAAVAQKASKWLLDFFVRTGMKARTIICLYDALLTMAPLEERFLVKDLHQLFMTDINVWEYHSRWMNYPIDTDLVLHWSRKPDATEAAYLNDPEWHAPDPEFKSRIDGEILKVHMDAILKNPDAYARLNRV